MSGSHAARRQGTAAWKIVLAALAAPPAAGAVVTASLLLGMASAAFLALLLLAAAIVRIPSWVVAVAGSRLATPLSWALLAVSGLGLGVLGAGALPPGGDGAVATLAITCFLALLVLEAVRAYIRWRGRREWRESGGRAQNPAPRRAAAARLDANAARLDALEEWQQEIESLRRRNVPALEAVAGIVRAACEEEGVPVPPELQVSQPTMPLPRLYLVRDAPRARGA